MHACASVVLPPCASASLPKTSLSASKAFWHDVRSALRVFIKNPGFAFIVIVTLALGIGANTAIFQLIDTVRMRALPIANPSELAQLRIVGGNRGFGINDSPFSDFTVPMWQQVKQHHDPFSGVFAWRTDVFPGRIPRRVSSL